MKKTVILKAVFAAMILVISALALVTCAPEVAEGGGDDGVEYTNVVYTYTGSSGDVRVKSVKIYLDGTVVPRTAAARKLDLEAARMGHDYFEVVFWSYRTGTPNVNTVARAKWEIGQQAGISGVFKNPDNNPANAGVDYTLLSPQLTAGNANVGASAIFVGKKSSKTLLGVGYLSHINDGLIDGSPADDNLITEATTSVTFTVSPLQTWLGFQTPDAGAVPPITANTVITKSIRGDVNGAATTGTIATFMTAAGVGFPTTPVANIVLTPAASTAGTTLGSNQTLRTGAVYPQFDLPSVRNLDPVIQTVTIAAVYTVGGLDLTGATPSKDLRLAVRAWGAINGGMSVDGTSNLTGTGNTEAVIAPGAAGFAAWADANARGGLQFIKRTPAFLYQGTTYGHTTVDDKATKIALVTETRSDEAFVDVMNLNIIQNRQSNGVFAITFQQPVYLLTVLNGTNTGNLKAEKWFVRPDYGQYQYMLDNGRDSGGAVLLATDLATVGGEWIEIKTTGIGFDNE
jgi:hypothetical protein